MVVEQSPGIREIKHVCMIPAPSFTTHWLGGELGLDLVLIRQQNHGQHTCSLNEYCPFDSKAAAFKNNGATANEIFNRIYCATKPRSVCDAVAAASETRQFTIFPVMLRQPPRGAH